MSKIQLRITASAEAGGGRSCILPCRVLCFQHPVCYTEAVVKNGSDDNRCYHCRESSGYSARYEQEDIKWKEKK